MQKKAMYSRIKKLCSIFYLHHHYTSPMYTFKTRRLYFFGNIKKRRNYRKETKLCYYAGIGVLVNVCAMLFARRFYICENIDRKRFESVRSFFLQAWYSLSSWCMFIYESQTANTIEQRATFFLNRELSIWREWERQSGRERECVCGELFCRLYRVMYVIYGRGGWMVWVIFNVYSAEIMCNEIAIIIQLDFHRNSQVYFPVRAEWKEKAFRKAFIF
jgi:hypothetical protein